MKEGTLYGNDNLYLNNGNASDQPLLSKNGPQENQQIIPNQEITKKSEFSNSNGRLDNYHLTFSSRL